MSDPTWTGVESTESTLGEQPGSFVGRYKILRKLGEGGFGAVFEAEQSLPVKRHVALKIIKLGMDTREVIARFEAERQALALMDHPHIAKVLDAGATPGGRPYFVMELVDGEPIAAYCDRLQLSVAERLTLFEQVCQAVQHAHTKGIIHRDLKPGNVLVGTLQDRPFSKVIDFGIAKATSGSLSERTLLTEQHQMIGTPLYMSPEQAEGSSDIDTRTDIYSLGVLLYELLTGSTPFDSATLRSAAYAEVQRIIREVDPPRPSARLSLSAAALSSAAGLRRTEPGRLSKSLRGELDWIVMKAIEKDRKRRYETANGLAMDVRRYLDGQAVLAAPPSRVYRLGKFVRRNKAAVAAALTVAAALLVGIVGFAWQARIAERRAAELEQVAQFQAEMLAQVDPTAAGALLSKDVTRKLEDALSKAGLADAARAEQVSTFAGLWRHVNATDAARELIDRTILQPAAAAIVEQFRDQPAIEATLSQTLADRYIGIGLYDAALPLQQRALDIRRQVLGDAHPDSLTSINRMGELLRAQGNLPAVEPYIREALEKRRRVLGEDHPDTLTSLNNMGTVLFDQGKMDEVEAYYREALEKRRRVLGEDHADTLASINNLGALLQRLGKLEAAEPLYREALAKSRRVLGEEHPDTLGSINNLGALLRAQGKLDEAEQFYREGLDKRRRVLGEEHPDTLNLISNLGVLLQVQGKLDAAEVYYREALEKTARVLGEEHSRSLTAINNMAALRLLQGKYAEALALLAPAEVLNRKVFVGANAPRLSKFLLHFGKAHAGLGDFAAAESRLLEAQTSFEQFPDTLPKDRRDCRQALADLYAAWHRAQADQGYDAKAAEWQSKLAELDSAAK